MYRVTNLMCTPPSTVVTDSTEDVRDIIFDITGKAQTAGCAARASIVLLPGDTLANEQWRIECVHDGEADEPVFTAGDLVYIIERDEDSIPVDVSGYMFLARVGDYAIASGWINDLETAEETLAYHAGETRDNYDTDLCVFPFEDCYATQDEARAILGEAICNAENEQTCPLGGDLSDDCADCAYASDYHFVDGECVKREDEEEDCLVCKLCGHKQYANETVKAFKKRFPGIAAHDIPYYCGACQDAATDEEYEQMQREMNAGKTAEDEQ